MSPLVRRGENMRAACATAIGLVFAVGMWILPGVAAALCLTVEAEDPQRVVASLYLEPGGVFSLQFINSIYLAPVKETYRYVPPEGIAAVLVESPSAGVFEYYGLTPDRAGASAVYATAREIRVRSSDYSNHRLSTSAKDISLQGLVPDGDPMIIRVRDDKACGHPARGPGEVR